MKNANKGKGKMLHWVFLAFMLLGIYFAWMKWVKPKIG